MWLLAIAAFGLFVPNGLFIYWLFNEYATLAQVLSDKLAVAFILDAFMATGLLSYLFAVRPMGPVRWPWFLLLSLVGGLGFSIPVFIWLNRRAGAPGSTGPGSSS